MARPTKCAKTKALKVRIEPYLLEALNEKAAIQRTPAAAIVRELIERYITS